MNKFILSFFVAAIFSAQLNAQSNQATSFKPITIEQGYFEITRLPSKGFNGEIVIYEPDPETLERCDRCSTRYSFDKDFRVSVAGHITSEIDLEKLLRLPQQLAYFRIFEEGVVSIVGFSELIEGADPHGGL